MKTPNVRRLGLAGAVIAIGILAGCDSGPTPTPATAVDGTLAIELRNYEFEYERLEFKVGETVTFQLQSVDEPHTFTVKGLGINWVVPKEEQPQVERFTFDTPGTYKLTCTITGHEGSGMVGEVTILE